MSLLSFMLHICIHVRSHLWSLWFVSPNLPLFNPPCIPCLGSCSLACSHSSLADGLYWLKWTNCGQALSKYAILSVAFSFNLYFIPFSNTAHILTSSILQLIFAQNHLLLHAGAYTGKGCGLYSTEKG